jgi:uncharacterized membrane protein YdcZ (DUF606 family)
MAENSWIDENWSRDWLFWLGVGVATVTTALSVALTDAPVWRLIVGCLGSFALTVAVIGFARTAWRAYREQ